jgi:hypothetical protein
MPETCFLTRGLILRNGSLRGALDGEGYIEMCQKAINARDELGKRAKKEIFAESTDQQCKAGQYAVDHEKVGNRYSERADRHRTYPMISCELQITLYGTKRAVLGRDLASYTPASGSAS